MTFQRLKRLLRTPTFAFTALGVAFAVLWPIGLPYADVGAFVFLLLAGCGTAIALWEEVRYDKSHWSWRGLWSALRDPSYWFFEGFLGHLPQLLAAAAIALKWRFV